ncbi:MAG: MBL fold metallo-hydrolase [Archaeoglobus sp.]|uniref:MBL fold metallo-hydrolase n=1 Tax=Archaeoglobus sp. TaxID=1872626 RepID=UPI001DF6E684|nr:MBL fold metallo-hydrolase [Archaeoglobus sp.]MBO8180726.1 MBL fold metallo-hydrolase [Archaeoglobus sp.]
MKLTFLGTGVAVPYGNKAQSSILIDTGSSKILFDCGIGSYHRLEELGVSVNDIDAVCITHHHLDHNGDLLNILKARWLLGGEELRIYGPDGTRAFLNSLLEAYPYLRGKLKFAVDEGEKFEEEVSIRAIPTIHSIESRGYVVDDVVAISGDTRAFKDFMSVDCNVMVHELSLPFNYQADYHTTPENLKDVLKYCKAEKLYLTHLYPMAYRVKDEILEYLEFDAVVAEDMMSIRL